MSDYGLEFIGRGAPRLATQLLIARILDAEMKIFGETNHKLEWWGCRKYAQPHTDQFGIKKTATRGIQSTPLWSSPEELDGTTEPTGINKGVIEQIKSIPRFWNTTKLPALKNHATNELITSLFKKYTLFRTFS